jgi:hypothetical protein
LPIQDVKTTVKRKGHVCANILAEQ